MQKNMELSILKKVGLTDGEIKIYEALLNHGETPANQIIKLTGLKKGDCYNKIYNLIGRGFVEERTKDKKKHFRLTHPDTIRTYIENELKTISNTEREISALLPWILSLYNLTYHKPGVQILEGFEGIKKLYQDTLREGKPISAFLEVNESDPEVWKWLRKYYIKERIRAGIPAQVIMACDNKDNIKSTEYLDQDRKELRETRVVDKKVFPCKIEIQIYGNKTAFASYNKNDVLLGTIIDNKNIAESMRGLFKLAWQNAKKS